MNAGYRRNRLQFQQGAERGLAAAAAPGQPQSDPRLSLWREDTGNKPKPRAIHPARSHHPGGNSAGRVRLSWASGSTSLHVPSSRC